ncbi:hypothetical protein N9L68_05065 [bacterium]|nr:hypothetical protein [bacterium]
MLALQDSNLSVNFLHHVVGFLLVLEARDDFGADVAIEQILLAVCAQPKREERVRSEELLGVGVGRLEILGLLKKLAPRLAQATSFKVRSSNTNKVLAQYN